MNQGSFSLEKRSKFSQAQAARHFRQDLAVTQKLLLAGNLLDDLDPFQRQKTHQVRRARNQDDLFVLSDQF